MNTAASAALMENIKARIMAIRPAANIAERTNIHQMPSQFVGIAAKEGTRTMMKIQSIAARCAKPAVIISSIAYMHVAAKPVPPAGTRTTTMNLRPRSLAMNVQTDVTIWMRERICRFTTLWTRVDFATRVMITALHLVTRLQRTGA